MSFDSRETSQYSGQPYEMYLFQTATQTWRLTSADEPKTYLGSTYEPQYLLRSSFGQGNELRDGNLELHIARDHEIASLFISFIPSTPLALTIYRAHDGEAESETVVHWSGKVIKATPGDDCVLTCAPDSSSLKKQVPGIRYQRQCNRILYDAGCTINRNLFKVHATVLTVAAEHVTAAEFATKPDGWFTNGYLEFGQKRSMVIRHVGNAVDLLIPINGLSAGDELDAFAGCDRFYNGDCVNKFNNGKNFLGFQWIPNHNPFDHLE